MELKNLPVCNLQSVTNIVAISNSGGRLVNVSEIAPTGTIHIFAGELPPTGWTLCDGKYLEVALYPHLFHVIGYRYGGEAHQFRLPNLVCKVRANDVLFFNGNSSAILTEVVMNFIIQL